MYWELWRSCFKATLRDVTYFYSTSDGVLKDFLGSFSFVLLFCALVSLSFHVFIYIFFLFYFLLGLDNIGFHYLIQIKID